MNLNSPSIEDHMFSWSVIRETDTHLSEGMWGCHGVCRCMGLRRGSLLPIFPSTQWWPRQWLKKGQRQISFFLLLYCCSSTVVCIFSLPLPTPPQPNPPPSLASTLPFCFVHVSFMVVPEVSSPHCPLPPSHYPLPFALWLLLDCS